MIDRSTGKTQHNHNVNNTASKILIVVKRSMFSRLATSRISILFSSISYNY